VWLRKRSFEEVEDLVRSVDGRGCNIDSLEQLNWPRWHKVQIIDLSNNTLKNLPIELFLLPNVVSINASRNFLQTIPSLSECRAMVLDLSHNRLSEAPVGEAKESSPLVSLNLSFNRLQRLDENIGKILNRIQNLFLEYNLLESLPSTIASLPLIGRLTFQGNTGIDCAWLTEKTKDLTRVRRAIRLPFDLAVRYGNYQTVADLLNNQMIDIDAQDEVGLFFFFLWVIGE